MFSVLPSGDPTSAEPSSPATSQPTTPVRSSLAVAVPPPSVKKDSADDILAGFEEIEEKDPTEDDPDPSRLACHSAVFVHDKLFIFGGYNGVKCTSDVWVLNFTGGKLLF